MKKSCGFIGAVLAVLLFGCATTKQQEIPQWVVNYRSVYPTSEFIAQRGEGKTSDEAMAKADELIARSIQTNVETALASSTKTMVVGAGAEAVASEEVKTENRTEITSTVTLLNVEHPVTFYDKNEKKWYAMSVIDREEAWKRYLPNIDTALVTFNAAFKKASSEDEPFIANVYLRSAWEAGKILLERLEYARTISEVKEAAYKTDRDNIASIPARMLQNNIDSTLSVAITGDNGNIIREAVVSTFSGLGMTVGETSSIYKLDVVISDNATGDAETIYKIYPDIKISIVGKSGKTVYSYALKWNEANGQAAGTIERAERLAFQKMAARIKAEVPIDYRAKMGIKEE